MGFTKASTYFIIETSFYFLPILFKPNLLIDDLLERIQLMIETLAHADANVDTVKRCGTSNTFDVGYRDTIVLFKDNELLKYMDVHDNDASESSQPSWGKSYVRRIVADFLDVPPNEYSPRPNDK
ncbi:hypothetical protein Tco_1201923 [Tanacetum coccineum]